MKTRITDEHILQMIKEQEAGEKTADVFRRYGTSQSTFYKYKSKHGGMASRMQKSSGCWKPRTPSLRSC